MASLSDDEREVPLHHLRPFGSGLYNKKIKFVPAESGDLSTTVEAPAAPLGKTVSDLYLSMVLPKRPQSEPVTSKETESAGAGQICEICRLPVTPPPEGVADATLEKSSVGQRYKPHRHETTLAHQLCLEHSHPPSHLDRRRLGLSVLESQGWDADARQGLGPSGEGMRFPIKTVPKDDKFGLGAEVPKNAPGKEKPKEKPKPLDAGKVRKMAREDKKRSEKLRQEIFGNVDLEKYLGTGSGV